MHIEEFRSNPLFDWDDYMPPSGYGTFHQFFAPDLRPGLRPTVALCDPTVIATPADSTFVGWWQVNNSNQIDVKGLLWSIQDLLKDSQYADEFKNGVLTHSSLNADDTTAGTLQFPARCWSLALFRARFTWISR